MMRIASGDRQAALLNGRAHLKTRGWVDETNETVSQRTKEHENDYSYFLSRTSRHAVPRAYWRNPGECRLRLPAIAPDFVRPSDTKLRADEDRAARTLQAVSVHRWRRTEHEARANWVLGEVGAGERRKQGRSRVPWRRTTCGVGAFGGGGQK